MIKERFALPVLLALSSAQCVLHFSAYYSNPYAANKEWGFGLFSGLLAIMIISALIVTRVYGSESYRKDMWLNARENVLLLTLNLLVTLIMFFQLWSWIYPPPDSILPLWLRVASYASLFVAFWVSSDLWTAFFQAKRIIRERGFSPKEAKQ